MKTGGTMNFLKRAGAILMLVAIFASSCNKYADDFTQLNTKLDALAVQVAGVTQLTADMAALKTQVASLQTTVALLPTKVQQDASFTALSAQLKTVGDNVTAIQTVLTGVAANGIATKAAVDKLGTDLATLSAKITADNAAMTTKLNGLADTDLAQTAKLNEIIAANATLLTKITAIQTDMAAAAKTGASTDAVTALTIGGLQAMLNAQKLQLDQILLNTSMYTGNVTITTDAEVDFYFGKLAQMVIVNGDLLVDPTLITKIANMNTVLEKINAVIGDNWVDLYVSAAPDKKMFLTNLTSVSGGIDIYGGSDGATQAGIDIAKLASVSSNMYINLDGPLALPLLAQVRGWFEIYPYTTEDGGPVGTTSVDFPKLTVGGSIWVGNTNEILLPSATSIVMPLISIYNVSAPECISLKSTDAKIGNGEATLDIYVNADAVVDLSSATEVLGGLYIAEYTEGGAVLSANLSKLADAGGAVYVNAATVNTDSFNADVALTIEGAEVVSLPAWVTGTSSYLTANDALTVTAKSWFTAGVPGLGSVESLTITAANSPVVVTSYGSLVTLNVTGKTVTGWGTLLASVTSGDPLVPSSNPNLESVTLGGVLKSATISGASSLTAVTTSGVVNGFVLNDCDAMEALTLAHAQFEPTTGAPLTTGSFLTVTNNLVLESVTTTKLNKVVGLNIQSNAALTTLGLASLTSRSNGATADIKILNNAISGTFTNAVALVPGISPYTEAVIASPQLAVLNAYRSALYASSGPTVTLDIEYDTDVDGNAFNLSAAMVANEGISTAIIAAAGTQINHKDEWALVIP